MNRRINDGFGETLWEAPTPEPECKAEEGGYAFLHAFVTNSRII